jgi:glycosyltransferase involved in cell wall biosynthesis
VSPPLVSVIVPAFNAAQTLPDTLDSILAQTFRNFELIVVDDGSTDGTRTLLERVRDPRMRVIGGSNRGLAAARNRGIEHAHGQLLTFIDADDRWTPDKLEDQVEALERNPDAVAAYSWTAFIDQNGRFLFAKEPSNCSGNVYAELLRSCFVASGSNVLVRRSAVDAAGAFDTTLPAAQDWEFCLRLAARWPFALVPRYQVLYRIQEGTMSGNADRCEDACVAICERAFGNNPLLAARRRESLSNVKQYVAFLYLTRATGNSIRTQAGRRLAECIRLYPRTLLTRKTIMLLFTWTLLFCLPARLWRPTVTTLLRWFGRLRRAGSRELRKLPV